MLFAMVATATAATAKAYIEQDEASSPLSPRAVEGPTTGGGGGGGDVTTTVIEQGYSVAQMVLAAAVAALLAFAIGVLAQRAFSHRGRPLHAG
jgi:hypothetical protein